MPHKKIIFPSKLEKKNISWGKICHSGKGYCICYKILYIDSKNIGEAVTEMPQSGSWAFLRHQKERWGTNNDKTNTKHEITNAQTKKNYNRGTTLKQSVEKLLGLGLKWFKSGKTSPIILMQFEITDMFGRPMGPLPNLWNITMKHI